MPTIDEARIVLRQRCAYLTERIAAKKKVGWDYAYDERERDALARILDYTEPPR